MSEIELRDHPIDGTQVIMRFDNGYGASVVNTSFSYGVELAVIHFTGEGMGDYTLVYDTPVADDVVGHLDREKLDSILEMIEALPPREEPGRIEP